MKKMLVAPVLALTVGLLAGCGSLLGNIDIGNNVLPIDGKEVGLTFPTGVAASGLKAQAAGTVNAVKEVTSEFDDIDGSKIPITPAKIIQEAGIASVTLSGAAAQCGSGSPSTVSVKINELSASVSDASTKKLSGKVIGSFTATKGASGYTVSNVVLVPIELSGDFTVLTGGGKNTLTVKLDGSATSDPSLASCTLTIKLKGGSTKVGL